MKTQRNQKILLWMLSWSGADSKNSSELLTPPHTCFRLKWKRIASSHICFSVIYFYLCSFFLVDFLHHFWLSAFALGPGFHNSRFTIVQKLPSEFCVLWTGRWLLTLGSFSFTNLPLSNKSPHCINSLFWLWSRFLPGWRLRYKAMTCLKIQHGGF